MEKRLAALEKRIAKLEKSAGLFEQHRQAWIHLNKELKIMMKAGHGPHCAPFQRQ